MTTYLHKGVLLAHRINVAQGPRLEQRDLHHATASLLEHDLQGKLTIKVLIYEERNKFRNGARIQRKQNYSRWQSFRGINAKNELF